MVWDTTVEEVLGDENPLGVTGVRVRNVKTDEESTIACDGVFVAIGHAPSSELVKDQLETHMGGYVITKPDSTATDIRGVYRCGRCDGPHLPSGGHVSGHGLHGGVGG